MINDEPITLTLSARQVSMARAAVYQMRRKRERELATATRLDLATAKVANLLATETALQAALDAHQGEQT